MCKLKEVVKMKENIIGTNLTKARGYLELTRTQVAKILDMPLDIITAYEDGTRIPDSQIIASFAKLYRIDCSDILTAHNWNLTKDEKAIAELIQFKRNIIDF